MQAITSTKDKYNDYFERIIAIIAQNRGKEIVDKVVEEMFDALLGCLPNDGKLYKYRNFSNRNMAFDNTYDALREGYIWIADAKYMNDRIDVTMNINWQSERKKVKSFFSTNRNELLMLYLDELLKANDIHIDIDKNLKLQIVNCYTKEGRAIKGQIWGILQQIGIPYNKRDLIVNAVAQLVEERSANYEIYAHDLTEQIITFPSKARDDLKLFCLAESPKIESMWAYYGNSSNGFCIEYDFNKALEYNIKTKRALLNLFKVQYKKQKHHFSIVDLFKAILKQGNLNYDIIAEINKKIYDQMLVKSTDWKHEKEWRLIADFSSNKFYIDLVSAIYIDETMCNTRKGKKLIKLAREKNWTVIKRSLSATRNSFIYQKI